MGVKGLNGWGGVEGDRRDIPANTDMVLPFEDCGVDDRNGDSVCVLIDFPSVTNKDGEDGNDGEFVVFVFDSFCSFSSSVLSVSFVSTGSRMSLNVVDAFFILFFFFSFCF
jgi:hypothetical protein